MDTQNKKIEAKLKPVLLIDHLSKEFGIIDNNDGKKDKKVTKSEEVLLTLIASVIVEIVIREEL
jgi:hypothetical protein